MRQIKATENSCKRRFVVMPYMYPDLNAARDLANAGAACIMPLGAPIGSNKGLSTKDFIQILIDEIDLPNHRRCPESDVRPRHARQWRWEQPQLWQIQQLRLREMYRRWRKHLRKQSKRAEVRTFPDLEERLSVVQVHLHR